ncbi:hypothetical protein GOBAR_DD23602 [Gossypium barbadense]|nr:hypothetical protein GOBAR_DD23602 [Gossypium barbadense]
MQNFKQYKKQPETEAGWDSHQNQSNKSQQEAWYRFWKSNHPVVAAALTVMSEERIDSNNARLILGSGFG